MSLFTAAKGQWLKIKKVPKGSVNAQFVRLGIHEGEKVKCLERLPGGTIVLEKRRQQIAIGHELAKKIEVSLLSEREYRDE
jgi:Fe2+ transport system protein FeoA